MKYFLKNKKNNYIKYLEVHVHETKIIVVWEDNLTLYKHNEYNSVIEFASKVLDEENLDILKTNLKANLERYNIRVIYIIKKENNNDNKQYTLF